MGSAASSTSRAACKKILFFFFSFFPITLRRGEISPTKRQPLVPAQQPRLSTTAQQQGTGRGVPLPRKKRKEATAPTTPAAARHSAPSPCGNPSGTSAAPGAAPAGALPADYSYTYRITSTFVLYQYRKALNPSLLEPQKKINFFLFLFFPAGSEIGCLPTASLTTYYYLFSI